MCNTEQVIIVRIAAYELIVEIQADLTYPDALQDITNRAVQSFSQAVETMQKSNIALVGADELEEKEAD